MKSLKEKFGKFEMTKEQAKKVKGGSWTCHYVSDSGRHTTSDHSTIDGAEVACASNSNCAGCF